MTLYIYTGVPGSWKSAHMNSHKWIKLSSDEIRMELFWNYRDQSRNGDVFAILEQRLLTALSQWKEDIYIDSTWMNKKDRAKYIRLAKSFKTSVKSIFITTHPLVAVNRDKTRVWIKDVGKEIVFRMFDKLEIPSKSEWFDELFVVSSGDDMKNYKKEVVNTVELIKKCLLSDSNIAKSDILMREVMPSIRENKVAMKVNHDWPYHLESVWTHMIAVSSNAWLKWVSNNAIVSAIFHDIGKIYSKKWIESRWRYSFDWHEFTSINILDLYYKEELVKLSKQIPSLDVNAVTKLIKYHNFYDRVHRKILKKEESGEKIDRIAYINQETSALINSWDFKKEWIKDLYQLWNCDKDWALKEVKLTKQCSDFTILVGEALWISSKEMDMLHSKNNYYNFMKNKDGKLKKLF